jgi:hypothetical protein
MTLFKKHFAALAVASLFLVGTAVVRADEWDKRTVVTVDQTIQLPHTTLQPGTYVFKLLNSSADRHIVQIFNKDESHLITTILAINNYRLTPTGKTVFKFWETPAGTPPAVRAWFYPGDNFGQEFAYPKHMAAAFAKSNKVAVPTTTAETAEDTKTASVSATNENGQSSDLDTQAYTKPEETPAPTPAPVAESAPVPEPAPPVAQVEPAPAPVPAPEPEPQPTAAPAELPHTASPMPLVGLIGSACSPSACSL